MCNFPAMKKSFYFIVIAIAVVALSWGVTGHRTVGKIAENHLTPKARAGIKDLLGDQSLADVSTWADEVRREPSYKQTGPWHYINLPLGLSYDAFKDRVENMLESNVYSALVEQMRLITDKSVPREKKVEALKFIVHFVGDLHQPMHISRAEDQGGNKIQLNYDGQGTNLHSVWDSKLIETQGLDYQQLASTVDHASAAQIRQWQNDPLVKWMYESYVVSSRLYAEVDSMSSRSIGQDYYNAHIAVINQRLEQAGIRLAGLLNVLFKNGPVPVGPSPAGGSAASPAGSGAGSGAGVTAGQGAGNGAGATAGQGAGVGAGEPVKIDTKDAASHVDQYVIVHDKVYGYKALDGLTLVNVGAAYPDQLLTVVLKGDALGIAPALDGKMITVTGKVEIYKGKPEIVVKDPKMITF